MSETTILPIFFFLGRTLNGCPTGQTKITRGTVLFFCLLLQLLKKKGYDLPAKYVLHTVGPIGENPKMLASAYRTCLEMVLRYNIKSVAFCGIRYNFAFFFLGKIYLNFWIDSTGIYGYPLYKASHIALK